MKTREEAAEFAHRIFGEMFDKDITAASRIVPVPGKIAWHWGRCEIKAFMDFIYEGEPQSTNEEIWHEINRRDSR